MPNLQGLWAGTWSAPWFASFTVNGNLPCAISFFCRGNTPEFNESLLSWIEERLPEMRDAAESFWKTLNGVERTSLLSSGSPTETSGTSKVFNAGRDRNPQ